MSIVQFLKQIDIFMLKFSTIIAASWDGISARSLRLSWRNILPEGPSVEDASEDESCVRECSVEDASEDDSCVRECVSIFKSLGLNYVKMKLKSGWKLTIMTMDMLTLMTMRNYKENYSGGNSRT